MQPKLVLASANGSIREDRNLLMVCDRGGQWMLPSEKDLVPLPEESELFLLPGRFATGLDPVSGKMVRRNELAVAAFAAPGYTLSAHPAYLQQDNAPLLPLFAYGAVGYARGRFWLCATKVDNDPRQRFEHIKRERIGRESRKLLEKYPRNRLVAHIINNCVRRYDCPAARNFALGRYEAPLPSSQSCNAQCLGCISYQAQSSPVKTTPQCRLAFTPSPAELAEVMSIHEKRERKTPIYSFGQGCEGDPLLNIDMLCESVTRFRSLQREGFGHGTVNCNTNASLPDAVAKLAPAGFTSIRVSLSSARPELYNAYYRPRGYSFADVAESIRVARKSGLFVSVNLLWFPGVSDTREEVEALGQLAERCGIEMIQMRNLNIDPRWYLEQPGLDLGEKRPQTLGPVRFMELLRKRCPWMKFGYFNPWLGDKAELASPLPA